MALATPGGVACEPPVPVAPRNVCSRDDSVAACRLREAHNGQAVLQLDAEGVGGCHRMPFVAGKPGYRGTVL